MGLKDTLIKREEVFNRVKLDLETKKHELLCNVTINTATYYVYGKFIEEKMAKNNAKRIACYIPYIVKYNELHASLENIEQDINSLKAEMKTFYINWYKNSCEKNSDLNAYGADIYELAEIESFDVVIKTLEIFIKENSKLKKSLKIKNTECEKE